jgi:hypothetical protein
MELIAAGIVYWKVERQLLLMELIAIKQSLWHLAKGKFWIIDD